MNIQQFDYKMDLNQALLWQYNSAPNITSIVNQKQAWYDINVIDFWNDWFTNVFNLITANEFGLRVWSLILDIPLFPDLPIDTGKRIWGFGTNYYNFDNGNFSYGKDAYALTIEEKRLILRMRYFQLTSRCAIPEINEFLSIVFKALGPVYVLDTLKMKIVLVFGFDVNTNLARVIRKFDLIPRGSGVGIKYRINPANDWGFENTHKNFNNGGFAQEF